MADPDDDDISEVVITAPDQDWLVAFTRQLVADRLAACGHHTAIRSVYTWDGQIHDEPETRVALHTRVALVETIIARARSQHPYAVPGVIALPITAANPDYRAWILDSTDPSHAGAR